MRKLFRKDIIVCGIALSLISSVAVIVVGACLMEVAR